MEIELVSISHDKMNKKKLQVPPGSSIAAVLEHYQIALQSGAACGVFGEFKPLDYIVQKDDRLELYQPLPEDPKHRRMVKVARSTLPRRCR